MYARDSYSADVFSPHVISEQDHLDSEDFFAGEPVCGPPRRGMEAVPYTYLFLLLVLTVGCAFANDVDTRKDWTAKIEHIATALVTSYQSLSTPAPMATREIASADTPGSIPRPPTSLEPAPPSVAVTQPLPEVTVSNAPGDQTDRDVTASAGKTRVSDAYAPPPPTSDPYRKKAEAAGLHPDLSRVVLQRLTPTDYRNAAYAIQKALTTLPNDGEFTWPRARKKGAAVFNVHFVEGAAQNCRRYVVTITKDRWTSTALPMEKCGIKVAFPNATKYKTAEKF